MPSTHQNAGIPASCFIDTVNGVEIVSFASALAFLNAQTGKARFKVNDETQLAKRSENVRVRVLRVDDGTPTHIGVVLYQTVIVTYRDDETFTCDTGGFMTPTTVTRLNQFTPKPYQRRFGRGDRQMFVGSKWADQNANRFSVAEFAVVGEEVKAPALKRHRAKVAHGTLRWYLDPEGNVYSTNDLHREKMIVPVLDYEAIGRDDEGNHTGDYTAPLKYNLEIMDGSPYREGAVGIAKSDVPLDLANAHRVKWGMPAIELVAV